MGTLLWIWSSVKISLTGLWPIFLHNTLAVAAIAALVALACFVDIIVAWPPFRWIGLAPVADRIRNGALIAAAAVALGLFFFDRGVSYDAARCKLQISAMQAGAIERGTSARARATRDVSRGLRDPQDTDSGE